MLGPGTLRRIGRGDSYAKKSFGLGVGHKRLEAGRESRGRTFHLIQNGAYYRELRDAIGLCMYVRWECGGGVRLRSPIPRRSPCSTRNRFHRLHESATPTSAVLARSIHSFPILGSHTGLLCTSLVLTGSSDPG